MMSLCLLILWFGWLNRLKIRSPGCGFLYFSWFLGLC
jgi:hypothetical protein